MDVSILRERQCGPKQCGGQVGYDYEYEYEDEDEYDFIGASQARVATYVSGKAREWERSLLWEYVVCVRLRLRLAASST